MVYRCPHDDVFPCPQCAIDLENNAIAKTNRIAQLEAVIELAERALHSSQYFTPDGFEFGLCVCCGERDFKHNHKSYCESQKALSAIQKLRG